MEKTGVERFIVVQEFMVKELNLKGNELLVYAIIYGFSQAEGTAYTGSLTYICSWCKASKQGVIKNLKNLVEKGLIQKNEIYRNGVKFCEYRATVFNTPGQHSLPNKTIDNKEDNSLPPIIPRNAQERFFTEFQIVVDNYDVGIMSGWTEADWANLAEQFRKSEWLRKNVKTTSMLCRLSTRILAGAYAPFEKVQAGRGSELLEEERRENADWFDRNFGDVE